MASYDRLGSFLVADALATTPYGTLHRAVSVVGPAFARHHLLCTFPEELLEAGLAARGAEIQRAAAELGQLRGIGGNYQFETGKPAFLVCDYVPGRSLAQVLDKAREEQVPFGVDHALSVLHAMAQAIIQMHDRGVRHGALSTHSVWVSYEGAAQILDAPIGAILQDLLPKAAGPEGRAGALPPRPRGQRRSSRTCSPWARCSTRCSPWRSSPPARPSPRPWASATLKAAQEDAGDPERDPGLPQAPAAGGPAVHQRRRAERRAGEGPLRRRLQPHHLQHGLPDAHPVPGRERGGHPGHEGGPGANYAPYLPPAGAPPAAKARAPDAACTTSSASAAPWWWPACSAGLYYKFQQHAQMEQQEPAGQARGLPAGEGGGDAKLADIAKQEEAQKTLEDMFGKQAEEGSDPGSPRQRPRRSWRRPGRRPGTWPGSGPRPEEKQKLAQQAQILHAAPPAPRPRAAAPAPVQDAQPTVTRAGSPQMPAGFQGVPARRPARQRHPDRPQGLRGRLGPAPEGGHPQGRGRRLSTTPPRTPPWPPPSPRA